MRPTERVTETPTQKPTEERTTGETQKRIAARDWLGYRDSGSGVYSAAGYEMPSVGWPKIAVEKGYCTQAEYDANPAQEWDPSEIYVAPTGGYYF